MYVIKQQSHVMAFLHCSFWTEHLIITVFSVLFDIIVDLSHDCVIILSLGGFLSPLSETDVLVHKGHA